jgi:hypothetical protein
MTPSCPDSRELRRALDLAFPLIGLYDAPDPSAFEPLVRPAGGQCLFAAFDAWLRGKTLLLTADRFGCGGCGRWLFGAQTRSRDEFIRFLVEKEGLKASRELMERWIESSLPYRREHDSILIGPLRPEQGDFLKTVIIPVNPDQLSALVYGTQYHSAPEDPPPMIAPFGSGCMQLIPFADPGIPQAALGSTDLAMRKYLPPDLLLVSATVPMFRRLCALDRDSFLGKPFLRRLKAARGGSLQGSGTGD